MRAPLAPPRLSLSTIGVSTVLETKDEELIEARTSVGRGRSPRSSNELGDVNSSSQYVLLQVRDISLIDHFMVKSRDRISPNQLFFWQLRAYPAGYRTHVAMQ